MGNTPFQASLPQLIPGKQAPANPVPNTVAQQSPDQPTAIFGSSQQPKLSVTELISQPLMEHVKVATQSTQMPLSVQTSANVGLDTVAPPSRKRHNKSNSSGETSPFQSPISSSGKWSSFSPSANPFLEQEDVIAFSAATLIKDKKMAMSQ